MGLKLDNSPIDLDDRVFDVVRGWGDVIEVNETAKIFTVKFRHSRQKLPYNTDGVNGGTSHLRTLFWNNPVVVVPAKGEKWTTIVQFLQAVVPVLRDTI